jgi:hypothetical protein
MGEIEAGSGHSNSAGALDSVWVNTMLQSHDTQVLIQNTNY